MLWSRDEPEPAEVLHIPVAGVRVRLRDLTPQESDYIEQRIIEREVVA